MTHAARFRPVFFLIAATIVAFTPAGCGRLTSTRDAGSSWRVGYFQDGEYVVVLTGTGEVVVPGALHGGAWLSLRGMVYFSDIDVMVCKIVNTRTEGVSYIVLGPDARRGYHGAGDLEAVSQMQVMHAHGVTPAELEATMVHPRVFVRGRGGNAIATELGDSAPREAEEVR